MIYRGWGILALLIPVIAIILGISLFGEKGNATLQLTLYSVLCAAPIVFLVGIWLNRKPFHDLYFIPLQYWGLIWAVLSIAVLLLKTG